MPGQRETDKITDLDKGSERIEQGEAWDEGDEVVEVEVKKPLDKVIPIRLLGEKWEELRKEARELGIGPTTLCLGGCGVPHPTRSLSTPTISELVGHIHPSAARVAQPMAPSGQELTATESDVWLPRGAGTGVVCRRPLLGSMRVVGGGQAHGEAPCHVGTGRSSLERLSYRTRCV